MNQVKHPAKDKHKAHIIVVNDDRLQLSIISGLLKKGDHDVSAFSGAEKALEAMGKGLKPDLIVTDLHMPGIDGWRFCRLLRSDEYKTFNDTPILVVSATFSGEDPERISADLGANAFLPAPVQGPHLLMYVTNLLAGEKPKGITRVLIVEDSRTVAHMLVNSFTKHGYNVVSARTGREALSLFQTDHPEIVILDYHLPDTNGSRLIEEFNTINPRSVIIVITADSNPELSLEIMKLGARAYVRKPFDPEYLIALCINARRELSLLHAETLLENRTRELRSSELKYRFLAEKMNDIVWTSDLDLRFTYVSPSVKQVVGFTPEEWLNKDTSEIITPESLSRCNEMLGRVINPGGREEVIDPARSITMELEYYHENGTTVWMENVVSLIIGPDGNPTGIHGVSRDITERRSAALEREELVLELKQALADVKILRGMLPICASCKKIRDDKGYWNRIESYIEERSDAVFSHGICPECAKKLYPDIFRD